MAIATWRTDGWWKRAMPYLRSAYEHARHASNLVHTRASDHAGGGLTCPSAPCKEDAHLLGIVGATGAVGLLDPTPRVSAAFVAAAAQLHPSETRFRFADRCIGSRCRWWADQQCGLAEMLVTFEGSVATANADALPACPIRSTCRWYSQAGARACVVCPSVVTDLRVDVVAVSDVAPGGGGILPAVSPSPEPSFEPRRRRFDRDRDVTRVS